MDKKERKFGLMRETALATRFLPGTAYNQISRKKSLKVPQGCEDRHH